MFERLLKLNDQLSLGGVVVSKAQCGAMRYSVQLIDHGDSGDILRDGMLITASGCGKTLDAAADDYFAQIMGERLCFNATRETRREVIIPILYDLGAAANG